MPKHHQIKTMHTTLPVALSPQHFRH